MAILSQNKIKAKSLPGHHVKIIETLSQILGDPVVVDMGEAMRRKRNLGLYSGGVEITAKECGEYLKFVRNVLGRVRNIIE